MLSRLVSIIVPCYNQAQFLDEALQSVLEQTYTNWECIIVNDGSPDHTEEVAKKWVAKDNRFIYLKKENGGLSSARNAGITIAEGEYIQFLDSDDLLNKLKLEKQLKCFTEVIDVVICDYFPFDSETISFKRERYINPFPDIKEYRYEVIEKWESSLSIPCHCILFKAKLLKQNSSSLDFDESLPNHEDWVFWVKLFYYSTGIYNLKYSLVGYRIHNKSMCHDYDKMNDGFIKAASLISFFLKSQNDIKGFNICEEKIKSIQGKNKLRKTFSLKRLFSLFIPPIFNLIYRKTVFYKH